MARSIVILIAHFGRWPPWINFFAESCRFNRNVDWVLFSDCGPIENASPNLRVVDVSFDDYKRKVSHALDIRFDPEEPYKLCDIRPAFGVVHRDIIDGYDFFGFGDLDVIYGRLREFYNEQLLSLFSAISSHPERVSGHLFLLRNEPALVEAFQLVQDWQTILSDPDHHSFDEDHFTRVLKENNGERCWFREAYSTPAAASNMLWYWNRGILANEFYPHRSFLYLHFMHWRSSRWYRFHPHVRPGAKAPWESAPEVIHMDWRRAREDGFMISPRGIEPLSRRPYPED
jgi:hypothetical protein